MVLAFMPTISNAQDELPPVTNCGGCIPSVNIWVLPEFTNAGNSIYLSVTQLNSTACIVKTSSQCSTETCLPQLNSLSISGAACYMTYNIDFSVGANFLSNRATSNHIILKEKYSMSEGHVDYRPYLMPSGETIMTQTQHPCCYRYRKCDSSSYMAAYEPDLVFHTMTFASNGSTTWHTGQQEEHYNQMLKSCCNSIAVREGIGHLVDENEDVLFYAVKLHCTACNGVDPANFPEIWEGTRCQ